MNGRVQGRIIKPLSPEMNGLFTFASHFEIKSHTRPCTRTCSNPYPIRIRSELLMLNERCKRGFVGTLERFLPIFSKCQQPKHFPGIASLNEERGMYQGWCRRFPCSRIRSTLYPILICSCSIVTLKSEHNHIVSMWMCWVFIADSVPITVSGTRAKSY